VDPKDSRGRWGYVLASWLDHPDVDVGALAVLAVLAAYADPSGLCWPHPTTIAEKLKRSRPWVLEVLDRLVDAKLIERRACFCSSRLCRLFFSHFLGCPLSAR
jgi:hypothetical protein